MATPEPAPPPVEIHADRTGTGERAAIYAGDRLVGLEIDRVDWPVYPGDLFRARVTRLAREAGRAFVDLGKTAGEAVLRAADLPALRDGRVAGIGELLAPGAQLIVQIRAVGHGRGEGKLPLASCDPALASPALIHLPRGRRLKLSRGLTAAAGEPGPSGRPTDPGHLKDWVALSLPRGVPGGWILRRACLDLPAGTIAAQAARLARLWAAITKTPGETPGRLAPAPPAAERALADWMGRGAPLARVACAEPGLLQALSGWAGRMGLAAESLPLSCDRAVDPGEEIALATRPAVPLVPTGGLIIEETAAATVIDVNSGSLAGAARVNRAALPEIARQLALRNPGGAVLVDFAGSPAQIRDQGLGPALAEVLAADPAGGRVLGLTRLGLMEIERPRRGAPLSALAAPGGFFQDGPGQPGPGGL